MHSKRLSGLRDWPLATITCRFMRRVHVAIGNPFIVVLRGLRRGAASPLGGARTNGLIFSFVFNASDSSVAIRSVLSLVGPGCDLCDV